MVHSFRLKMSRRHPVLARTSGMGGHMPGCLFRTTGVPPPRSRGPLRSLRSMRLTKRKGLYRKDRRERKEGKWHCLPCTPRHHDNLSNIPLNPPSKGDLRGHSTNTYANARCLERLGFRVTVAGGMPIHRCLFSWPGV